MLYKNITESRRSGTSGGPSQPTLGGVATLFWLKGEIYDFLGGVRKFPDFVEQKKKEIFEDWGRGVTPPTPPGRTTTVWNRSINPMI